VSAPVISPEIENFVEAVRRQLDDLPAAEIDELTDGLAADLADALSDGGLAAKTGGGPTADRWADPAAYAAELRAAAGLPARGSRGAGGRPVRHVQRQIRERITPWRVRVQSAPWWPWVRDRGIALRPTWWVLRGLMIAAVAHAMFPHDLRVDARPPGVLLVLCCVVASTALGRRTVSGPSRGFGSSNSSRSSMSPGPSGVFEVRRWLVGAVNALAVVTLLAVLSGPWPTDSANAGDQWAVLPPQNAVYIDGVPATNLFAYDAQGRPLPRVQLFDQDGRPVTLDDQVSDQVSGSTESGGRISLGSVDQYWLFLQPVVDTSGSPLWNAFPLLQVKSLDEFGSGWISGPADAPLPMPSVPTLRPAAATPAPTTAAPVRVTTTASTPMPTTGTSPSVVANTASPTHAPAGESPVPAAPTQAPAKTSPAPAA